MRFKKIQAILLSITLVSILIQKEDLCYAQQTEGVEEQAEAGSEVDSYYEYSINAEQSYADTLIKYEEADYKAGEDIIVLQPEDCSKEGNTLIKSDLYERASAAAYSDGEESYTEWSFEIESAGLYVINAEYLAIDGNGSRIQRELSIDGEVPFSEAKHIYFSRLFVEDGEVTLNSIGDEVWPEQIEKVEWQSAYIEDSKGFYEEPLQFYLEKGRHTLRFTYIDQPIAFGTVTLSAIPQYPSYEQLQEQYQTSGLKEVSTAADIKFQAEDSEWRNDTAIRRESDPDPKTEPFSVSSRVLNILGGYRWRTGNQSVTWSFKISESGLYKISLKVNQSIDAGLPSYRQITIDGMIPFQEMELYQFDYAKSWYGETLADENGEAYLFYLEAGDHVLTMKNKMGPFSEVIERTTEDVQYLSEVTREITKITGTDPDPNYEYDLYRVMPELSGQMSDIADRLEVSADILREISNETSYMENNYRQIIDQLRNFAEDVDRIPKALTDLNTAQTNLGSFITSMEKSPLAIDYIEITSPATDIQVQKSNFLERAWVSIVNFFLSFTKDYDSIGKTTEENNANTVLDVWIARGTEWGEILKQMADEDFTPKTGVVVNVNVLPGNQLSTGAVNTLMLSITSGKAPDVAIGVDYNLPSEFAFRDAAVDLTQFEGYEETASQFYSQSLMPYQYGDGVYALPETMDFTVMIYRKDIMSELGLKLPQTWTEVINDVLPVLYENNMSFALPVDTSVSSNSPGALRAFTMLLLQKQGSYYTEDQMESALDLAEGYQAFKMWTDLYRNYGVDEESNFFTRMRTGTMPIGIGNYTTYMQLATSAPELYGMWGIAPVPGMELEDGTVDHSVGTMSSTAGIILNQSEKQEEAWQFLSWWMSEETQMQYGRELEALIGESARWNTANVNAFNSLPWDLEDINVIKVQMESAKEQLIVPGGYFTGRHIINAWNRVILNDENVRDSLEEAVKDINKELETKRKEFGLEDVSKEE